MEKRKFQGFENRSPSCHEPGDDWKGQEFRYEEGGRRGGGGVMEEVAQRSG